MKATCTRLALLVAICLGALMSFQVIATVSASAADPPDQCPTINGYQPVDICVPLIDPRARILKVCVTDDAGKARIRLKNKGEFGTEVFSIYGANTYREVNVKLGETKTVWAKHLTIGKTVRVKAHGRDRAGALVKGRPCRG